MSVSNPTMKVCAPKPDNATANELEMARAIGQTVYFLMQRFPHLLAVNIQFVFEDLYKGRRYQSGAGAVQELTPEAGRLLDMFREAMAEQCELHASRACGFISAAELLDMNRDRKTDC